MICKKTGQPVEQCAECKAETAAVLRAQGTQPQGYENQVRGETPANCEHGYPVNKACVECQAK